MAALSKKFKFFNFCFSNGVIVYQKLWQTSYDFYIITEFVLLNVEIEKIPYNANILYYNSKDNCIRVKYNVWLYEQISHEISNFEISSFV